MTPTAHRLTVAYLDRLQAAARVLPPETAADLLADISEHLDVALAEVDPGSPEAETRVRDVLGRLGEPADLVADAMPENAGVVPGGAAAGAGLGPGREASLGAAIAAVILLMAAGLIAVVWPVALVAWVVGLVLFVRSTLWSTLEKTLGGVVLGSGFPLGLLIWGVAGLAFWAGGTGDNCIVGSAEPCSPAVSPAGSELWFGAIVLIVPVVLQLVTAGILIARARRRARAGVAS